MTGGPEDNRLNTTRVDELKIEWWKKNTMAISRDVLDLSGYLTSYSEKEVVVIKDGKFETAKVGETKDVELRFAIPAEKKDYNELRVYLNFYEWKKLTLNSYDVRILELQKSGKIEKVKRQMMEKELCKHPLPGWDRWFNGLLDTLALKATEMAYSEMRQMPDRRWFRIYDQERELNNE
ncbi:MAG: hypothetical protein LVQ63_07050 [Thermoplasmatales archaeon]|nr:hypothetical protein [Thermoplasmatales archaeon]